MIIFKICNHPDGIKPLCNCGENAVCPHCGYGWGSSPCRCDSAKKYPCQEIFVLTPDKKIIPIQAVYKIDDLERIRREGAPGG